MNSPAVLNFFSKLRGPGQSLEVLGDTLGSCDLPRKVWMIKSNRFKKWFPIFNAYKHLVKNHCWTKYAVHEVISFNEMVW